MVTTFKNLEEREDMLSTIKTSNAAEYAHLLSNATPNMPSSPGDRGDY